jgi:Clostripain family
MKRQRASSSSGKKLWTFLVYLAGDNNLSADMVWSLQEMKKAARDPRLQESLDVSVLFDPAGTNPRRYDIIRSGFAPASDEDGDLHELPWTDYPEDTARTLLRRFLKDRLASPSLSGHRLVVLSGHGSGAVGELLADDAPRSALSISSLGKILGKAASGAPIDVLGLDSCEMGGVEVGYEIREAVRYLVASEGLVFDAGWPYHRIVESFATRAGATPRALAREIASRYLSFYEDYDVVGLATDVSVTDLGRLDRVAESVGTLATAMSAPLDRLAPDGLEEAIELGELDPLKRDSDAERARDVRNAIVLAHWSAQSYKCDRYTDLHDFVAQLLRFSTGQVGEEIDAIRTSAARVLKAIDAAVVFSGTTGADFQHSHGLSIYFPWSSSDYVSGYRKLAFSKAAGWWKFLEAYLRATLRMRRDQRAQLKEATRGRGLALDSDGHRIEPLEPLRGPTVDLASKDVDSGTHKDVDSGTHKGETCRSTMKNPPDGYYLRTPSRNTK